MKSLFAALLFSLLLQASPVQAQWQPHWDHYADRANPNSFTEQMDGDTRVIEYTANTCLASCDGLSVEEIFGPSIRVHVRYCSANSMDVAVEYFRSVACDQCRVVNNQRIQIRVPHGCAFSVDSGRAHHIRINREINLLD